MRLLSLYFPRLSTALARRADASLQDRALVLVTSFGDGGLVAGASVEAAMTGVVTGMPVAAARNRCPGAAFIPDNATACLDELEEALHIIVKKATPNVAIASREHLVVDLAGLEGRFVDEATAASRLAALVREWTGLDVRAGVGNRVDDAIEASKCARRAPAVAAIESGPSKPITPHGASRAIAAHIDFEGGAGAKAVRAQVHRLLFRLQLLLEGGDESARRLRVVLERADRKETLVLNPAQPIHTAADMLEVLAGHTGGTTYEGLESVTVSVEKLGPAVRVERQAFPAGSAAPVLRAPVRPVQQRLLRAG